MYYLRFQSFQLIFVIRTEVRLSGAFNTAESELVFKINLLGSYCKELSGIHS